jgi:hypothetical protein
MMNGLRDDGDARFEKGALLFASHDSHDAGGVSLAHFHSSEGVRSFLSDFVVG